MHPYNPYEFFTPDFAALAKKSAKLSRLVYASSDVEESDSDSRSNDKKSEVKGKNDENLDEYRDTFIDFQDPDSSIALTEAMLEQDFGIHVLLRQDRLCPPIPNRINYIAWLQEIIDETQPISQFISSMEDRRMTGDDDERPIKRVKRKTEQIRVLDIGTGASCIYPILGCALDDWDFVATDVDADSIASAQAIIDDSRNQGISQGSFTQGRRLDLRQRIHLSLRKDSNSTLPSEKDLRSLELEPILWSESQKDLLYHAVMCNPPFYSSKEEMQTCFEAKVKGPSAVCLGSESEMICEGGEIAFVNRIIDDSVRLKEQVFWFTSMIGKFNDIFIIIKRLVEIKPESILITEFSQGKTKRWGIAWSFLPFRLNTASFHAKFLSIPALGSYNNTSYSRPLEMKSSHPEGKEDRMQDLYLWLEKYSLHLTRLGDSSVIVMATSKTWSRSARRARLRGQESLTQTQGMEACILCVRITIVGNSMIPTWLYGPDKTTWDSFYSTVLLGWLNHTTQL